MLILKSILVTLFLLSVLVLSGCTSHSESKSVAVSSPNQDTVVSVDGEVSHVVEVDPSATEVRLWLYMGQFAFDNENVYSATFYQPGLWENRNGDLIWSRPKPWRSTIQGAVKQRFPGFTITRIIRGKEKDQTIYYISLNK